jgi:uncharacterized membrane protein
LIAVGAIAIGVAFGASKLGISPWWILVPGGLATALLALLAPQEATCDAAEAVGWAYLIGVLVALASFVLTPLTAFVDAIRHRAAARLLPALPAAALAIVTFFIVVGAIGNCLD